MAFAVLVSITAEAEQEPLAFTSAFARSQLAGAPGGLDRAALAARPLRAVDADGAPLPIVQARYVAGDPRDLAANSDEIEPNGALKQPGERFPAVDRSAKGDPLINLPSFAAKRLNGERTRTDPTAINSWPHELEDPRDDEFDPGHTMSSSAPGRRRRAGAGAHFR